MGLLDNLFIYTIAKVNNGLTRYSINSSCTESSIKELVSVINKETYKNKFHSLFEIDNSHEVFKNLSEILFTNFGTFKQYSETFDSAEKNYINKNIYWGMESSILRKFKSLKNITINNGSYMDILELGLEKYLED